MTLIQKTKELVKQEKLYTAKILSNLALIENKKLYCDFGHNSLFNFIRLELGYSENEATLRVNAVRLMKRSESATKFIEQGTLSLSNAAIANQAMKDIDDPKVINQVVDKATSLSARELRRELASFFKRQRRETLMLDEHLIQKMDKVREIYGDLSNYELVQALLEKVIKENDVNPRERNCKQRAINNDIENNKTASRTKQTQNDMDQQGRNCKQSTTTRYIPIAIKRAVYQNCCANCGGRVNLEYDHILKFSHGGKNTIQNLQMLCRNCNMRKEIKSRDSGFFS